MKTISQGFFLFLFLTGLTGVVYPLAVTAVSRRLFPYQAGGSLLVKDGRVQGSELLAQKFQEARYFWPRPSAVDYGTTASGAGNQGPTNAALQKTAAERATAFRAAHGMAPSVTVPAEMAFASGSGLDPHISPQAAHLQIGRVLEARKLDARGRGKVEALVEKYTEYPTFGILGQKRVNVLKLNMALDSL